MNFLLRHTVFSKRKIDPKPKPDWLETDPGNYEYLTGKFGMTTVSLIEIVQSSTEPAEESLTGKFNMTKVDLIPA